MSREGGNGEERREGEKGQGSKHRCEEGRRGGMRKGAK